MVKFGERRLLRGAIQSTAFRLFGVLDPAHYLRWRYFRSALRYVHAPRRILDVGCGTGDYAMWLARVYPNARIVAIDIDARRIERAAREAAQLGIRNVGFVTASAEGYDGAPFDFAYSVDVLEHIPDQRAALCNIARLLRPDGTAYFHVPTIRERPVLLSRRLHGFHAWAAAEHVHDDMTHTEFTDAVASAGLRVISRTRTFGRWTGELANSLFVLLYGNSAPAQAAQFALAPMCRALARLDRMSRQRYAVAVLARR